MTRDEAWEIAKAHFTVAQLDDDPQWASELLDAIQDDPDVLAPHDVKFVPR